MLPRTSDTNEFWQAYRRHAGLDNDNYVVGSFGDSPEMATELADLVVTGSRGRLPAWHGITVRAANRHPSPAISS
jgi:hypothetical protein